MLQYNLNNLSSVDLQGTCIDFATEPGSCFNDIRMQFKDPKNSFSILNKYLEIENIVLNIIEYRRRLITLLELEKSHKNSTEILQEKNNTISILLESFTSYYNIFNFFTGLDESIIEIKNTYSTIFKEITTLNSTSNEFSFKLDNIIFGLKHFLNHTTEENLKGKGISLFFNLFVLNFNCFEIYNYQYERNNRSTTIQFKKIYESINFQNGHLNETISKIENLISSSLSWQSRLNDFDEIFDWKIGNVTYESENFYEWENVQMIKFSNLILNNSTMNIGKMIQNLSISSYDPQKPSTRIYSLQNTTLTNIYNCSLGRGGPNCTLSPKGFFSNDGFFHLCMNAPPNISEYTQTGQHSPDCEFRCLMKNHYRNGNNCLQPSIGMYLQESKNGSYLNNCTFNFDQMTDWYHFISPGILNQNDSCNITYRYLFKGFPMKNNISSFTIHLIVNLKMEEMNKTVEFLEFPQRFKFIFHLMNSSHIKLGIKYHTKNSKIFSNVFPISDGFLSVGVIFDHNTNLLIFFVEDAIDIIMLDFTPISLTFFTFGGSFPYLSAEIKKFTIYQSEVPLLYLRKLKIRKNNASFLCDWGFYLFNNTCSLCPNNTIGSYFPRKSHFDCKCLENHFWMNKNSTLGSCEKLNLQYNRTYFHFNKISIQTSRYEHFSSPLKFIFQQNWISNITEIQIYKDFKPFISKVMNNYTLKNPGVYSVRVKISLEEKFLDVIFLEFKILKKLPLPLILPHTNISSSQRLHIISKIPNTRIFKSINNENMKLYQNNSFVKPGDVLKIKIESNNFEYYPNELKIMFQRIEIKQYPQFTSNLFSTLCSSPLLCFMFSLTTLSCILSPCTLLICPILKRLFKMKRSKKIKLQKNSETELYEFFIVLYDFDPVEPNEIELKEGSHVLLISKDQLDGWWYGVNSNNQYGYFPCRYVKRVNT
eukprot:gene955-9862_t